MKSFAAERTIGLERAKPLEEKDDVVRPCWIARGDWCVADMFGELKNLGRSQRSL